MATPSSIPCPTCGKSVSLDPEQRPEAFPFCDPRCRIRDLGAWADGRHVVAGAPLTFDGYDDA